MVSSSAGFSPCVRNSCSSVAEDDLCPLALTACGGALHVCVLSVFTVWAEADSRSRGGTNDIVANS